jgi:hypothetical protein
LEQITIRELHDIADTGSKIKITIDGETTIVEARTGGKNRGTFLVFVGSEYKIDENNIDYKTSGSKKDLLAEGISI